MMNTVCMLSTICASDGRRIGNVPVEAYAFAAFPVFSTIQEITLPAVLRLKNMLAHDHFLPCQILEKEIIQSTEK